MSKETIHFENSQSYLKIKAEKALEKAKEIEQNQLAEGKRFIHVNSKTVVLR